MDDRVDPHLFVVLGGTGDLMERKLLPALYHLARQRLLGERFAILGVSRSTGMDDPGFRRWARDALRAAGVTDGDPTAWCDHRLHYHGLGSGGDGRYAALRERVETVERAHELPGNRTLYLALPPGAVPDTIRGLGESGLHRSAGWTRLVIEKPFGRDLASARELNALAHGYFQESQLFRIDHYLGKETVQNLLVFRFANAIFESLWHRDRVANVQVTVAETLGVEDRAGYYEQAGALRDIVQNHLTQLLTLIGMEVPVAFDADAVRYEKVKLLRSIARLRPEDVVVGQYRRGTVDGREVPGYREEPRVAANSLTETYVAMRLELNTWRWQGVPFYVRTGKRLARRVTQIAVTFERPPVCLFESLGGCEMRPNVLLLTLQPDEGFALRIDVKAPGEPFRLQPLPLHFHYHEAFGAIPDAYETLLLDVLKGDQTLFVHADETEAAWQLYAPLLDRRVEPVPYAAGTWGPPEAEALLERDGHRWVEPELAAVTGQAARSEG
jgi:glucose-6-phosphate 1-dehydrogenase